MKRSGKRLTAKGPSSGVDAFLRKVAATPARREGGKRGRLLFAMDATASREPTWDRACHIQAQMFDETDARGGLHLQLCYYRGFRDFHATTWLDNSRDLSACMTRVRCAGGLTQIGRVLAHAIRETKRERVDALVFVGDCMEEEIDELCHAAGELGLLGVPVFLFQEGREPVAERTFKEIARLSGGAYCGFDATSARQLRDLLSAVAVFAAGGRRALEDFGKRRGGVARQLTHQVRKDQRNCPR